MNEQLAASAKKQLEDILSFFGYNVDVETRVYNHTLELDIPTQEGARLIGHRGETLAALQQLMNNLVRADAGGEHVYVTVDVGDYKKARAERLAEKVKADAVTVRETGETKRLRPMNAAERRIVHMALADMEGITTESEGEGRERRVVIHKA